jgi:hypothetical protein
MAKAGNLQIEWFNVTYRSVTLGIFLLVAVLGGGGGYWYWAQIHTPRSGALDAIERAEQRLIEAGSLERDEEIDQILDSAEVTLREAHSAHADMRFDEAKVAAIRSENLSLKALRMSGAQETTSGLVRFFRLEGDVRVKRAGEFSWNSARNDSELHLGDQVKTASSASAQLIYFDGTRTTIQPGSLLEIRELYENPLTKVRRVKEKLNRGEVRSSTQKRNVEGSFHEVATDKAAARSDEAGSFRVSYNEEKKSTSFDVFEGRIEVASATRKESVVGGESIRSSANGELSSKQVLPDMPLLISPRDQRVFISESPLDEKITLNWHDVPKADRYHLVISDRALFTEPLYDAERASASAVLDGAGEGTYYWRVAAISAAGLKGPFSTPRRFRISSQKIRDRTDVEPPDLEITEFVHIGMMVIVNGRTEPGATLWADNEKIDVYDDGTFYSVIRLRREGLNKLRFVSQDTAGNEASLVKSAYVETF